MADRKKRHKLYRIRQPVRCRNCGAVYSLRAGGDTQDDEVPESLEFCVRCAVRCPHCDLWISSIEAEVTGKYEYNLIPGDSGKAFDLDMDETWDRTLVKVWCPICKRAIESDRFHLD